MPWRKRRYMSGGSTLSNYIQTRAKSESALPDIFCRFRHTEKYELGIIQAQEDLSVTLFSGKRHDKF